MLAAYITSHGFGHAARTCDVLAAFHSLYPDIAIKVVSTLPSWFVESRLPGIEQRHAAFDLGVVQTDAVRMDLPSTLSKLEELMQRWDPLVKSESEWLCDNQVKLALADIPAIPLEAASNAGTSSVALTNFSWDWIYSGFLPDDPRWKPIIERFIKGYRCCERLFRYPFSGPMPSFADVRDMPLVAKPGQNVRASLAQATGADPNKKWLLFCFNSLDFTPGGVAELSHYSEYQFFTTGALNWNSPNAFSLDPSTHCFADLAATVDAVVSKPGFGILSDCAANNKPILYVERKGFREYPVMVEGIHTYLQGFHLPLKELYQGRLRKALVAWEDGLPAPQEQLRVDGAEEVARHLHTLYVGG